MSHEAARVPASPPSYKSLELSRNGQHSLRTRRKGPLESTHRGRGAPAGSRAVTAAHRSPLGLKSGPAQAPGCSEDSVPTQDLLAFEGRIHGKTWPHVRCCVGKCGNFCAFLLSEKKEKKKPPQIIIKNGNHIDYHTRPDPQGSSVSPCWVIYFFKYNLLSSGLT